jgi:hypothetical protein
MRKESYQLIFNSYEKEIKKLLIEGNFLKNESKELKTLIDLMRKTSNKLL